MARPGAQTVGLDPSTPRPHSHQPRTRVGSAQALAVTARMDFTAAVVAGRLRGESMEEDMKKPTTDKADDKSTRWINV